MNILHVMHSHDCGGAERHFIALSRALCQAGYQITLACPQDSWLKQNLPEGVKHVHLPMHGFFDIFSLLKLAIISRRFDLMHGHLQRGSHYIKQAAKISKIPTVYTAHSTDASKHFPIDGTLIAVSEAVATILRNKGFTNVNLVYNGVPEQQQPELTRKKIRTQLSLDDSELAIVMLARILPVKGHDILLDALSHLSDLPLRTFFIGSTDTSWGKELQQRVNSERLKVEFLGESNEPEKLLSAMDLLVAPSKREAISLSLIEAAGSSLPLIGSNVGGIPEVVLNDYNGILLPSRTGVALAKEIRQLYNMPEKRQRMADNSRKLYLDKFTVNAMSQATSRIYEQKLSI